MAFLQSASIYAAVLTGRDVGAGQEHLDTDGFLRMLEELDTTATDALLAALAVLIPDTVPLRIARNDLPTWLVRMREARVTSASAIVDALRDADNLLIEVTLADERSFTIVALVDHNLGSVVKDVFPLPGALAEAEKDMRAFSSMLTAHDEAPRDVAARLRESIARTDALHDPPTTDTWPACRPLLDWALRMIPSGGAGWDLTRPTDLELEALGERIVAGSSGPVGSNALDVVVTLLDFAATTALRDPLRWSPTSIEILLMDWLPRMAPRDVRWRAQVPRALKELVPFAHAQRGVPASATREALRAIDFWWRQAKLLPRGQEATTEPSAADSRADRDGELRIRTLQREAGGSASLNALTVGKLPKNERLLLDDIPEDVRPAVTEVARLVDAAVMELFGDVELRTVTRRIIARAFATDPSIVRRSGSPVPIAAAVTWIAAKANDCFTQSRVSQLFFGDPSKPARAQVRVKDVGAHFGLTSSPSTRAAPILAALGRSWPGGASRDLGDPALLTSTRRAGMIQQRDFLRLFGD
ncbi:MAG: hypothetical protein HIU86_14125 [Acidobacteria bacterium]|nr:hypothetical protein [Acidobacteriota bacterium]